MEKTDTRFHHASGKDTPLLVDTRMATFLHKKRPGLSHLSQCTERPSTVPLSFQMGKYSVVEDFSCLNNAVGDIVIGDHCRIGLSNTVIGPIRIDNGVNISQNVALIGLDHNYQNITQGIIEQGITTSPYPHRRTYHHRSQRDCTARNHHRQTLFYRCWVCGYPKHTRLLCHGRKSRTHYQTL